MQWKSFNTRDWKSFLTQEYSITQWFCTSLRGGILMPHSFFLSGRGKDWTGLSHTLGEYPNHWAKGYTKDAATSSPSPAVLCGMSTRLASTGKMGGVMITLWILVGLRCYHNLDCYIHTQLLKFRHPGAFNCRNVGISRVRWHLSGIFSMPKCWT